MSEVPISDRLLDHRGSSSVKTPRPRFIMELEALPGDQRPAVIRLRQILKLALRGFQMRCVAISESVDEFDVVQGSENAADAKSGV